MRTGPDDATITEALKMLAREMSPNVVNQWTDAHIPRTERPVRFGYVSRQCAFSRVRISIVTRSPFPPARAYW